jgi:hypothetical protein
MRVRPARGEVLQEKNVQRVSGQVEVTVFGETVAIAVVGHGEPVIQWTRDGIKESTIEGLFETYLDLIEQSEEAGVIVNGTRCGRGPAPLLLRPRGRVRGSQRRGGAEVR